MVHVYEGEGKGKTTAAIGQAIRAAGAGILVFFVQFMKGADTSEWKVLESMPLVQLIHCDRPYPFYGQMSEEEKAAITCEHNEMLNKAIDLAKADGLLQREKDGMFDVPSSHDANALRMPSVMIVLDEITYPLNWNLIDTETVYQLVEAANSKETGLEVVCTGRNPDIRLLFLADYHTEFMSRRHPYDTGTLARRGIDR